MPGSPSSDDAQPESGNTRALHPLAWFLSIALVGCGLALTHSWIALIAAALLLGALALRAEGRGVRGEAPLVGLALLLFLAHVVLAGRDFRTAIVPAALIAARLLALLYLLRWAARVALGPFARWLMGKRPPRSPRFLLLIAESARLTAGLLPLALREAEQHVTALRGRGIRPGRGLRGLARYLLAWFLPFLGTMLRIGEAYADALTARGYVPGRPRRTGLVVSWGLREWGVVVGALSAAWFVHAL